MKDPRAFGAAALLALPFAVVLAALAFVAPASPAQHAAADPLVQLLGRHAPWLIVAGAVTVGVAWTHAARVQRDDVVHAVVGAVVAVIVACALRLFVGPRLPSFIPPEESSAPGVTLGLSAGLVEEVVFRLLVLPGVYLACRNKLGTLAAAAVATIISGVLFSLSHELGPAGGAFETRFLITRFLIPGVGMSCLAFAVSPSFIVSAHCTAHLLIPALFQR